MTTHCPAFPDKQQYSTVASARGAVKSLQKNNPRQRFQGYLCHECNSWHVGSLHGNDRRLVGSPGLTCEYVQVASRNKRAQARTAKTEPKPKKFLPETKPKQIKPPAPQFSPVKTKKERAAEGVARHARVLAEQAEIKRIRLEKHMFRPRAYRDANATRLGANSQIECWENEGGRFA